MAIMTIRALPPDGTRVEHNGLAYTIGATVSREGLALLPAGTTLWDGSGRRKVWTSRGDGRWVSDQGDGPQGLSADYNTLRSLPDGQVADMPFGEFRARFAEAVRACAARYSDTHLALAEEILDRLGVNDLLIGSPVFYNTPGKTGDIAVFAEPDHPRFTIFRHDGTDWVKAHGFYDSMKAAGQCRLTSGGREVGDDEAEVAAFKDQAWAAGAKAKQEHQWCSAYDKILADFDIVDPDPRPDFSAWETLVKGVEARDNLPDGSVLAADRGDWGIFVKENGDWVRKAGTRPLAAGTMRLLFDGNEGPLEVEDADVLKPFLPDARFDGSTLIGWG